MRSDWPEHFRPDVVRHAFGGGRLSAFTLSLEAWRRGLDVTFHDTAMRRYTVSDGNRSIRFSDSRPSTLTRADDYRPLLNKSETIERLRARGVSTPVSIGFDARETDLDGIRLLAEKIGYPLVIKPEAGSMGQGVHTGLRSWEELRDAYTHVLSTDRPTKMVIESHFDGDDHRILVIGDRVVAATRRVKTHVIGDGRSTVEQLIRAKNAVRKENPFLSSGLIKVDYEVTTLLTEQDLSLESVPREGQHVGLRRMANGSAGGDIVDVTDELPSAIKDAAVRAVHVFDNIHIAGVDLLRRPSESGEDSYVIIEMNSRPHIPTNMYPSVGTGRDVPRHFIDHFFPETPRSSQPGDDSLVYDYPAAETLQRTRVTSSVTLRPLPEDRYPVRRFVRLVTGDEYVNMPRIRRERLESRAERLDIVGDITQPEREVVHAVLGASDEESMQAFVTLLTEALRGRVIESSPHNGILTTGMRIARPLLGRKR